MAPWRFHGAPFSVTSHADQVACAVALSRE